MEPERQRSVLLQTFGSSGAGTAKIRLTTNIRLLWSRDRGDRSYYEHSAPWSRNGKDPSYYKHSAPMEPKRQRSVLLQTFGSYGSGAGMAKIRLTTNIRLLWSRDRGDRSYYEHSAPWSRNGKDPSYYKHSAPMEPKRQRSVLLQTFGSYGSGAGMAKIRLTTNIRLLWSRDRGDRSYYEHSAPWSRNGKDPSYYKHSAPLEPERQRSVLLQTFGSYGAVSGEDRSYYEHSAPMEPERQRSVLLQTFGSYGAGMAKIRLTTNIRLLGAGMAKIRLTTNIRLLWRRERRRSV